MRIATAADLPALTALWKTCFDDSEETIGQFWESLFDHCTVYTEGDCAAMAIALPTHWQDRPAAYLYAVCTSPAQRGQGLCRRLLEQTEHHLHQAGCSYATLVPADDALFSFYGGVGYQTCFYSQRQTYEGGAAASARMVSSAEYAALRKIYAPRDSLQYAEPQLAYQAHQGALLEIPGIGCAAVEKKDAGYFARELLSPSPEIAAAALCAYLGCNRLPARTPGTQPFAMAKSLDGAPLTTGYLGLDFG